MEAFDHFGAESNSLHLPICNNSRVNFITFLLIGAI
jgi:hypothetical protein